MAHHGKTGECANGLYIWATNMIVVQTISRSVIEKVARNLIDTGEIESVGHPISLSDLPLH
jgi:hypothetical protein